MPQIREILNEYVQEIDAPDQLKEIIVQDIPAAIDFGKTIATDHLVNNLNEVSSFLSFTKKTVKDQFENESWMYADNFYDSMPHNSDMEPNFSKIYSWKYAHRVDPDLTKEDYDKVVKAWENGNITSEVAYSAKFEITTELEKTNPR